MRTTDRGGRFTIIGENIHATRVLQRKGSHVVTAPDGREAIRFSDADGAERFLALPDEILSSDAFAKGKVKHVRAALLVALRGPASDAADATAYLASMARRQVDAGADYLDLNVDEIAPDPAFQLEAIRWLVPVIEAASGRVPVSIDSSSSEVIAAGLAASGRPGGAPFINSASLERLEVLDLAVEHGSSLVVTAVGRGGMPANADQRVANLTEMIELATARGLGLDRLHADSLVLPIAVDPAHGTHFLESVRRLRAAIGPDVHLTGGLSNVSFGLPERRLLNDVFIDLAVEAGADSGIVDPVASDFGRVFAQDRASRPYGLAADLLLGRDLYGGDYLAAYRRGELAVSPT